MRLILGVFPLLAIPIVIYNIIAFSFSPSEATPTIADALAGPVLTLPMVSSSWTVTGGDLLLLGGLVLLFAEMLKSTSTGAATILNHAVSMVVFIVALVQFLLLGNFATSVFFLLTVMALLDVLAGVVVTIVSARRDFTVGEGIGS
jgi:hypothetical protein